MVLAVFYDIDGTIVGNIMPQIVEWHLVKTYQPSRMAAFKQQLIDTLKHNLVRPGFVDFHNGLAGAAPHVECFIYTAADHVWAQFLVPCLEKALDIQFNRPIFTRRHVIEKGKDIFKSLKHIGPIAHRALTKKGYQVSLPDILKNAVLIDNSNVFESSEVHRLIKCPTYNYTIYPDVLRHLPLSVVKENMLSIQEELINTGLFPSIQKNMTEESFLAYYYGALHTALQSASKVNKLSRKDVFWSTVLSSCAGKIGQHGFKDNIVKSINKRVQSQVNEHGSKR